MERKALLANLKHQYHVSQYGEHDCCAQSQKECRFSRESKFDSFDWQTLIIKKLVERKAFLVDAKRQYHVS